MKQQSPKPTVKQATEPSIGLTDEQYFALIGSVVNTTRYMDPLLQNKLQGALRGRNLKLAVSIAGSLSSQMYEDPSSHFEGNQIANLIRKYPWESDEFRPEEAAKATFLKGERRNRWTNRKLRALKQARSSAKTKPHVFALERARQYVRRVLGAFSEETVLRQCDLSGGASLGTHGNATNLFQKWNGPWTVTRPALDYAIRALWSNVHARDIVLSEMGAIKCYDPAVFEQLVRARVVIVDNNKIGFVNKTVLTKRVIAVEPLLNNFLQKGVDLYMRSRLLLNGIDLSDQSKNQRLAALGSKNWLQNDPWVTIDLTNASGSLVTELVKKLSTLEWFEFLDSLRCSGYELDGERSDYEGFVSMGNGFCFPLESLIFASICHAAGCDDFSVYGDDIIVRRSRALYVIELLKYCGFQTNVSKTFLTGPFRESCGGDYFDGEDVRPFVSDRRLVNSADLMSAHNGTLRNSRTVALLGGFREELFNRVPVRYRYVGRITKGLNPDCYFMVDQDVMMASPHTKWDRHLQTWKWKAFVALPVQDPDAVIDPEDVNGVDMYALIRGGNLDALYTLRYTVKRKTAWVLEPSLNGDLIATSDGLKSFSVSINEDKVRSSKPCSDAWLRQRKKEGMVLTNTADQIIWFVLSSLDPTLVKTPINL